MTSIDEARILRDVVENGRFDVSDLDGEQAAEAACQVWQMHKHGAVGEPWVEDGHICAELTTNGKALYGQLGPLEAGGVGPAAPTDALFAAEMLRHAAEKVFPRVASDAADATFTFSAGSVAYVARVRRSDA